LVGGKWTTFRAFAEQVADKILADLGRTRRTSTHDTPIGGREAEPAYHEPAALAHLVRTEAVVHLDDLLLRRTPLALFGQLTPHRFAAVAELVARELGWSPTCLTHEVTRTRELLATRYGVQLSVPSLSSPS
jgi:glycerol-3-phosphate dehydrogenase